MRVKQPTILVSSQRGYVQKRTKYHFPKIQGRLSHYSYKIIVCFKKVFYLDFREEYKVEVVIVVTCNGLLKVMKTLNPCTSSLSFY